MSICFVVCCQL